MLHNAPLKRVICVICNSKTMAAVMFQRPPFFKLRGSLDYHSMILDPSLCRFNIAQSSIPTICVHVSAKPTLSSTITNSHIRHSDVISFTSPFAILQNFIFYVSFRLSINFPQYLQYSSNVFIIKIYSIIYRIVSNCGPGGQDQFLKESHN